MIETIVTASQIEKEREIAEQHEREAKERSAREAQEREAKERVAREGQEREAKENSEAEALLRALGAVLPSGPSPGPILVIWVPMVRTIRQPPKVVPSDIAV